MSDSSNADATAQVRWLIVGRFSATPSGRRFRVRADDFAEVLETYGVRVSAPMPPALGTAASDELTLEVRSLRDLSMRGIIDACPNLAELRAMAEAVGGTGDAAVERVRSALAGTPLLTEIEAALAPSGPKDEAASLRVDDVLEATAARAKDDAGLALDAFVRNVRGSGPPRSKRAHRNARDAIERAAYGAARVILESAEIASIESTWRGLRFLLDQCPAAAMISIEAVDATAEETVAVLEDRPPADLMDAPDAIFVAHRIRSIESLERLARLGEEWLCPVVVGIDPALFGAEDDAGLADALDDLEPARAPANWLALRSEESARFLCAVANELVVYAEGVGSSERAVLASGAWAVAAQLSASYRRSGSFGMVKGASAALRAPAVRTIRGGRNDGTTCATGSLFPARAQSALERQGLLALGSVRNTDQFVLSSLPMARGSWDVAPLPAQIVTGRVVRFARWVREQLPEGTTKADVVSVFESGARVLLFPGMGELARIGADVREMDGRRVLAVEASISAAYAGSALEFAFALPLEDRRVRDA